MKKENKSSLTFDSLPNVLNEQNIRFVIYLSVGIVLVKWVIPLALNGLADSITAYNNFRVAVKGI